MQYDLLCIVLWSAALVELEAESLRCVWVSRLMVYEEGRVVLDPHGMGY